MNSKIKKLLTATHLLHNIRYQLSQRGRSVQNSRVGSGRSTIYVASDDIYGFDLPRRSSTLLYRFPTGNNVACKSAALEAHRIIAL